MDVSKVETNGVSYGTHPTETNQQDSKTNDKLAGKPPAPSGTAVANASANIPAQQSSGNTSSQPVVPPLVLAQKATKNDKKSQNSFAIISKKRPQTKDEVRRVTRHSPQNSTNNSETNSTASPTKSASTASNGRPEGTASASTLSPAKANSKQLPTKQVFAHKRSPSSPLPPNPFVNSAQVKATKSKPTPPPTPPKDPTPTLKANFLAAQKSRAEANSVPKVEVKRTKRKGESKKSTEKPTLEDNDEPRASKRVRLQYQPFQSPEPLPPVPFMYRTTSLVAPKKEEEEKMIIYNNNEFLAVRNETNGFFICRAKQNVFKNSRKFKIQWFNNDKNPAVYTADFYDTTDFECILTNLSLIRLESGRFQLPDEEKQRINNILQRAINVEKGTEKPDPIKMIADGVDISVVGKVDEKELLKKMSPKRTKKETVKSKKPSATISAAIPSTSATPKASTRTKRPTKTSLPTSPSTSSKTITTRQSRTGRIRRSSRSTGSTVKTPSPIKTSPKDKKPGIAEVVKKLKTKARSAKLEAKKKTITSVKKTKKMISPKKKSPKTTGTASSEKKIKNVVKSTSPSPKPKKRFVLISNLNVSLYEKDYFFESTQAVPHISTLVDSKLLIRAVLLKNHSLLEKLLNDKKKICSLCVPRCLSINRDALSYAIEAEDLRAVKLLTDEEMSKNLAPFPDLMITNESTGYGSKYMFGHALRTVNLGRGGKEGNNALIKDSDLYGNRCARFVSYLDESSTKDALKFGIRYFTIEKLCAQSKAHSDQTMNLFLNNIVTAVRHGHCKLGHDLVEHAIKKGGFGFNELHKESLSSGKQFSPFRSISICKKAIGNSRITPIHLAAINPDPYFMTTLLSQRPDYTILDLDHWGPVHYAAVSTGPSNLEFLLSHGVSTLLAEKEGNTPLHLACLRNRVQNVETILRHESASDPGSSAPSLDKANRIGLTPLHIAAQEGFIDVVKALIKAGADAEKPTAATLDKMTPMMMSSQFGHLSVIKLLIECGANPEAVDKKHRTALTHAVMNGQSHVVSYLLRLGANPNTRDSSGNNLVHYACAYGWYFCYKLLMEAKAKPNEPNDWKMTPLCIAFMKGHTGLAEAVMKESGVDIDIPINDTNGMNLLMQTCESKPNEVMIDRLKFLIERGADCTKTDYENNNALHYLVKNESRILSEHSYYAKEDDRQKTDENGNEFYDPIQDREVMARNQESEYLAIHQKEVIESERQKILEAAQLLIDNKCDPNAINKKKMSPFMLAAQLGSFVLLHKLLDLNRKQLNAETNSDGNTLLHLFVNHAVTEINSQGRKTSVAKFVRDIYESDETLKSIFRQMSGIENKAGLKPIHQFLMIYSGQYAVETEEILLDFLRFLVETLESDINSAIICQKPEDIEYVIHLTAKCKTKSFVNLILSKKPLLEQLNGKKRTALTIAVITKNIEISKLMIESGADVKFVSENDSHLSLLLLETINNTQTFELIPLLVSKGANVNDSESKGMNTALHYIASRAAQKAALSAVEALIKAGTDVNAQNKNGRTPLHLAVNSRRGETDASFDVEECLLRSGAKTDIQDSRGRIALHYAFVKIGAHRDHSFMDPIELVALLDPSDKSSIGQQTSVDVADNFGATPLHYAAQRGATISCMHILKAVTINPVDNNDNTPLGLAVLYRHEGCALMLEQKGASFTQPVGILNRKPELRNTSEDTSIWKWNRLKDEEKLKREIEVKKSKCSIIEEVVRNDWQGILYLMINELTLMGKGVGVAIEAALKTNRLNLAIKLLKRLKNSKNLNPTDQTLIHVLAKESFDFERCSELQQQIVNLLVGNDVQLSSVDSQFKSNSIIYSAINWNHVLCNEITQRLTPEKVLALESDSLLRTPVSAVFWDLHNKQTNSDVSEPMKVWINKLLEKNPQQLNTLSYYPIAESNYAGVRYLAINPSLTSISNSPKYSPLIFAIICGNYSVVKYLLNLKINGSFTVDIDLADSLGRTPLMHSVRLNDLKMVKLLLNRSYSPEDDVKAWDSRNLTFENKNGIDLTAKDSNEWTVLHHLVSPLENFTYLNSDVILRLLWHVTNNSKPEIRLYDVNAKNETPLQIAISRKAKNLVKTLNELLDYRTEDLKIDLSSLLPHFPKIETNFISEEFDFKSDSTQMIEKIDSQVMEVEDKECFKPDGLIAIDNADVVIDNTLDIPFDVLLTKVDLEYGVYGLYNFYKMQIIEQKNKDLVLLFTRWGRIGDIGQYQKTPFATLEETIKEFKKIFKAKTGNNWESVKQFTAVPKKYRLVDLQRRVKRKQRQYKVEIQSAIKSVESKLPTPLFDLMKNLINVHSAADALRSYGNGESFTPFGLLKTETLLKAESILTKIEKLVEEKESIKQKDSNDYSKVMNEIIDLSEEFYHMIPLFGYQYERLSPLFTREELRDKMEMIFNLLHFEFAFELLLGSQLRSKDVNPTDYIYRCLGTHLQLLDRNEEESQLILQFIHNTGNNPKVKAIFRINRSGEEDRFHTNNVGNNWMLWHGTKVTNVLSILANGLKKAPLSAQISGHLFGKGIYFADMFTKSQSYCSGFGSEFNGQKYMFLSEVSLGNVEDVRINSSRDILNPNVNTDKHSLKTSHSQYRPDPQTSVYWKGRSVPLGPSVKNHISENDFYELNYNEYIVFKCEQICLRYLIQFSD